jgi:hypothetical protein
MLLATALHVRNPALLPLGKLAPVHDARIPMLAKYTKALPAAPVSVDWTKGVSTWGMMRNDTIGDCTCAAIAHAIQIWTKNAAAEQTLSDDSVVKLYSAITGYNPKTGANDNGAVESDVLKYWLRNGVEGHHLDAFVSLQPHSIEDIKDAVWLFGGCYIGLSLPKSAQAQIGGLWTVPASGLSGDGAPGSWGGHAVYVVGYDARGLTVITWGGLQRMSWNFWWAYCDEAYGLLSRDWIAKNGIAASGFNFAALSMDIQALKA